VPTTAFLLTYARCSDPGARGSWEDWWDDVHLADVAAAVGADRATRWALTAEGPAANAGIGFTHVAMHDLTGEGAAAAEAALDALERAWPVWWEQGRIHERHVLAGADGLVGHGPRGVHPDPTSALSGRILAFVTCTDPRRTAEWDAWYDAQHLPDMMATDAFTDGTRWARVRPAPFAPRLATLYDIAGIPVEEAVRRSGDAMPGLVAAGRKPSWHAGGMTLVLRPAGRLGGAGWSAAG
jgi:hypothetical protein